MLRLRNFCLGLGIVAEYLDARTYYSVDTFSVNFEFYMEFLDLSWVCLLLYTLVGPSDGPAGYDGLLVIRRSWR